MTKAEIKKIQLLDASLFLEFQQFEDWFGKNDVTTQRVAARWVQTREILELLDVDPDYDLKENKKGTERQRARQEREEQENINQ